MCEDWQGGITWFEKINILGTYPSLGKIPVAFVPSHISPNSEIVPKSRDGQVKIKVENSWRQGYMEGQHMRKNIEKKNG